MLQQCLSGLHTEVGGPGIPPPFYSCLSGTLIGPQCKSDSQKGYQTVSFCAVCSMGEDTSPSHTLPLTYYGLSATWAIKKNPPKNPV